ncbi:AzlD domain-containing protein [Paenibacillus sp. sgz302251]|uniref:AzlD domain-containing protein n=1 Tax=Paenibacillus sp. sgz302251 TaxID=3414493 RepID=UPI003C7A3449
MKIELPVLLIILGCALVTIIPRIVPFAVIRNLNFPRPLLKWLTYIPVCLLTALIVQGVIHKTDSLPTVEWRSLLILIPTLVTALKTKSLLLTVLVGIVSAALVRFLF